jgi:uncharacterized protein YkwD
MRHLARSMYAAAVAATVAAFSGCAGGPSTGNGGGGGSGGNGDSSLGATVNATEAAQHNLAALNMYRAQNGAPALTLDAQLSTFSTHASQALAAGGPAHGYFVSAGAALWTSGFCNGAGENQAPGWPVSGGNEDATIDAMLKSMMAEGPGGGHHDNIVNPAFARLGVGLILDANQQLWLTNDFSNACP